MEEKSSELEIDAAPRRELPPDELMMRVAGTNNKKWFWESGDVSTRMLKHVLALVDREISACPKVLDWGCGCGRMLLHLEEVGRQIELYGVDIDADAISWAQEHIPWARCSTVEGLPPLPFPDKFFDLIYNHSVLTHLDDKYQDAWLSELRRIVKPSGMVVLTVHGDFAFNEHEKEWRKQGLDPEIWIDTFRRKGFLYITEDTWTKTFPDFYHTAFHAPSYVFEHWSRLMDIRAYVPRGALNFQDLILLQRREYDKGGRAIAELEEELAAAKARLASSEKVLADIHASWTWKIARAITSPLRLIR